MRVRREEPSTALKIRERATLRSSPRARKKRRGEVEKDASIVSGETTERKRRKSRGRETTGKRSPRDRGKEAEGSLNGIVARVVNNRPPLYRSEWLVAHVKASRCRASERANASVRASEDRVLFVLSHRAQCPLNDAAPAMIRHDNGR